MVSELRLMDPTFPTAKLEVGDVLLYKATGFFGKIISLKTWHPIGHCEGYDGAGMSVASRDGQGVNLYPVRTRDLVVVLRPKPDGKGSSFNIDAASRWFKGVRGQSYDWLGLLRFAWRKPLKGTTSQDKQFCSEFLTRWYRAGGVDPFNGADADEIAPFQFEQSVAFDTVWRADN